MKSKIREIDIQPTDRVAFIHIPKTAGTTFNAIIEPLLSGLSHCPEYFLPALAQLDLDQLRSFQVFRGHFPYALFSDIIFPEGFIGLTFLRDPVERTRSNYNFIHHLLKRDSLPELQQYAHPDEFKQIKHLTLAALLERTDLKTAKDWVNFQTGFLGGSMEHSLTLPAFLPKLSSGKEFEIQARYKRLRSRVNVISGINENREITRSHLNVAKERLKEIAFLGLVERFQDSLFLLSYTFGWRPILNETHLNITPEKDEWKHADPKTLSRIEDIVKLDRELYQFGQDIFESRFNDMTNTLLHRYGKMAHAKLRSPLPTDVMVQFLEQNYLDRRDCRAQQDAASADEYLYQPGSKVDGPFGWYRPDFSPVHGRICWSGPGVHSGFDLPYPPGTNIQISFRILMALQLEIIEQLSLTVNNIPVTLEHSVDPDGAFVFTGKIPPIAVSGFFLRLSFSVPFTIVPGSVDPNNQDPRQLGILLNWVKLRVY